MNKKQLLRYLKKLDESLKYPSMLYIYGSAVCILLDEPERTSLDIDVAAPYSDADYGEIVRNDCMVRENLENYRADSEFWKGGRP